MRNEQQNPRKTQQEKIMPKAGLEPAQPWIGRYHLKVVCSTNSTTSAGVFTTFFTNYFLTGI